MARAGEPLRFLIFNEISGRNALKPVLLGMTAEQGKSFTGTKIAFTRIPDMEEFVE